MSTWHRIDDHGIPVTFTVRPNGQGNFLLTPQELEGLMRTGGWKPGPIPAPTRTGLGKPHAGFPLSA